MIIKARSSLNVSLMNKKESIVYNLYETLETLRYPEVAQICFDEFQEKILKGPKRIDLLQWILTESPGFMGNMSLNMIKANTLNDKLFKCYSQIGLCNDENVLFGKSSAEKESQFLFLLTVFIKNLHLANNELLNNDDTILKTEKENVNTNNIDNDIFVKKENESELKTEDKSKEFSNPPTTESLSEKYNIDKLCLEIEDISKEINNRNHKNYEQSLHNFNSAFKNVSSLSSQSVQTNTASEVYDKISSHLQNIHSMFSTVNKTLSHKIMIKNQQVLENPTTMTEMLTSVIKDNLVLVEQACNTFVED